MSWTVTFTPVFTAHGLTFVTVSLSTSVASAEV
jgi:hypothetical protein